MTVLPPKATLLRHKLALLMGPEYCPVYDTIISRAPNALYEPWSSTMKGPYTLVVFDNRTFAMRELSSHSYAYGHTFQPDPIDCGENIKLYLDDELFREQKEAITIDFATLQRTEGMAGRALKSKWYFLLTGWVDVINGGLGKISRTGKLDSRVKSKMGSKTEIIHEVKNEEPNEELNGELNGEPNGELNGQQNGGPDEGSEGQ